MCFRQRVSVCGDQSNMKRETTYIRHFVAGSIEGLILVLLLLPLLWPSVWNPKPTQEKVIDFGPSYAKQLVKFHNSTWTHESTTIDLTYWPEVMRSTAEMPLVEYLANHNQELVWYRAYAVEQGFFTYVIRKNIAIWFLFGPQWIGGWEGYDDKTICVKIGLYQVSSWDHDPSRMQFLQCRHNIWRKFNSMLVTTAILITIPFLIGVLVLLHNLVVFLGTFIWTSAKDCLCGVKNKA